MSTRRENGDSTLSLNFLYYAKGMNNIHLDNFPNRKEYFAHWRSKNKHSPLREHRWFELIQNWATNRREDRNITAFTVHDYISFGRHWQLVNLLIMILLPFSSRYITRFDWRETCDNIWTIKVQHVLLSLSQRRDFNSATITLKKNMINC